MRNLELQYQQLQKGSHKKQSLADLADNDEKPLPRLDQFHQKHVSEDNESFSDIIAQETEALKEKKQWMYKLEAAADSSQLQLTNGEDESSSSSAKQLGWKYKTENQLMFVPNGIALTEADESKFTAAPKQILHENTRFPEPSVPGSVLDLQNKNPQKKKQNKEGIPLLFRNSHQSNKKINLEELHDETYAKLRNSPPKGNYDYLSTPVIQPGLAGESDEVGTSFVTWGKLQSTPQILSGSRTPESGYSMPPTPVRELVAKELTEKASKQHRSKKAKSVSLASKSIEYRRTKSPYTPLRSPRMPTLSPLKKNQLGGTPSRIHFGSQLSKSYSSPAARSLRKQTPSRTPQKRSSNASPFVSTPVNTKTTPKSPSSSSITDNLLRL